MTALTTGTLASATFPGLPVNVAGARAFATALLPATCPRAADVALVVSELATNAVLHSVSGYPGGRFEVRVDIEPDAVALTVVDQGRAPVPAPRCPGEGGMGLGLVMEVADEYEATVTDAGLTVWCRLNCRTEGTTL